MKHRQFKYLTSLMFCLCAFIVPATTATARDLQVATLIANDTKDANNQEAAESKAVFELNENLAIELCRRLSARCTLTAMPFAEVIPGVAAGRYQFAVANVMLTKEREKSVLFSKPLWRSSSRLIGTPRAIRTHQSAADADIQLATLRNARLAVTKGSQQQRYAITLVARNNLTLVETRSASEALQTLLDGKADFSLMPIRSAFSLLSSLPVGMAEFAGPALTENGLGGSTHIIVPPTEQALLHEIDMTLDTMRSDGTYQRIIRRYMPFLAD